MTGSVTLFGAESRSESVHVTHAASIGLNIYLTTNSQESWFLEKVSAIVKLAIFEGNKRSFLDLLFFFNSWSLFGWSSAFSFTFSSWGCAFSRRASLLLILVSKLLLLLFGKRFVFSLFLLFIFFANALN